MRSIKSTNGKNSTLIRAASKKNQRTWKYKNPTRADSRSQKNRDRKIK